MRSTTSRAAIAAPAAAALLAAAYAWVALEAAPAPRHGFFRQAFDVVAHRGGAALAPENTLAAFESASALGADVLEMDLRVTADDAIVVIHDATVDRTTDGKGAVSSLRLEDLQRLDAGKGQRVPALAEVLARFPGMRMNLEMKAFTPAHALALCALLRRAGMAPKVLVAAVDDAPMGAFRAACPEVATALTLSEARWLAVLGRFYRPPAAALEIPDSVAHLVRGARARGLGVYVWTVNDEARMAELIALGASGIVTDRPDVLREVARRRR